MIELLQNYLLNLTEETLHQLLKERMWKDLVKNSDDIYDEVDRYVPSLNKHIELKCRYVEKDLYTYMIEKHKYDDIIKYENVSYVCSGRNGIFEWDLKNYPEELVWVWEKEYTWSTQFNQQNEKKNKLVAYLPIHYAKWLHPKIFLYPFDINRLM